MSSLLDQLIDAWPFTEGAGTVAHGALGVIDLPLSRADQFSGDPLPAGSGWDTDGGGRPSYNGGGVADLVSAGFSLLAADGDAVTLACRMWMGGGVDVQPSYDEEKTCMIMGLRGHTNVADFSDENGWRLYSWSSPFPLDQLIIENPSSGTWIPSSWTFPLGSAPRYSSVLFVITIVRGATDVSVRLAVNGTFASEALTNTFSWSDPTKASFGCIHWARGAVTQAAMWSRALSDDEVGSLGSSLDSLFTLISESDIPLLDAGGNSLLVFVHPADSARPTPLIVTEYFKRETRSRGGRMPRRYTLRTRLSSGAQVDALMDAIDQCAYGAGWIRFRHPVDDAPGTPDNAPRYRLLNANRLALTRTRGGQRASFELELEQV
ncbi:MAG: hypothetical protein IT435_16080 [Phycisphaerales bacterium]|nr:hypothetical protein [Phycisphaerales bacterium]